MSKTKKQNQQKSNPPNNELTEAEWAIMKVVWEKEPCAAGTVQEALKNNRNWAYSTVKTTMDRMVNKELLSTQTIRNLTLFSSRITELEAKRSEFRRMLKRAFDGGLTPMMQFLLEDENLSKEDLKQLRKMVNTIKQENE
ncbi:MAG: BlaI/MecI/CopY family transcriptional regulator [Planctomycetota bacterium]